MFSSDHDPNALSVRVNSARMPKFLNKHVRLPCKVLKVCWGFSTSSWAWFDCVPLQLSGDSATVQASDGGEVNVHLLPVSSIHDQRASRLIAFTEWTHYGNLRWDYRQSRWTNDDSDARMHKPWSRSRCACCLCLYNVVELNTQYNQDLKLVNDTIELIHDSRFYGKMFSWSDPCSSSYVTVTVIFPWCLKWINIMKEQTGMVGEFNDLLTPRRSSDRVAVMYL